MTVPTSLSKTWHSHADDDEYYYNTEVSLSGYLYKRDENITINHTGAIKSMAHRDS